MITNHRNRFVENFEYVRNKAMRAIASLRNKIRGSLRNHVSFRPLIRLFDSHILPILDYGSEVWYKGSEIRDIEQVQLWFLKSSLGIKTQSSNLIVYGDTGRFPLLLRQQDTVLKYWDRLRKMNKSTPLYKVYSDLRELHNMGHKTWYTRLVEIFNSFECINLNSDGDPIDSSTDEPIKSIYLITKELRYKHFINDYFHRINDTTLNPLLRTYKRFKTSPRCEPYLLVPLNHKYRRAICQLRASSHHLGIELGRHTTPTTPLEKRLCCYCSSNSIDDEFHFVTQYSYTTQERKTLLSNLPPHIIRLSNNQLFLYLLNSKDEHSIKEFGKYIYTSFLKRSLADDALANSSTHHTHV